MLPCIRKSIAMAVALVAAACSLIPEESSVTTVTYHFVQPPRAAAACFARNARAHSSALVAEVGAADPHGQVTVNVYVKNGVPYATAELRPAGRGADGRLTLMVIAKAGIRQLVDELVEGC